MAAPSTFGVAADSVRLRYLPQLDAFSTSSIPTAATVANIISDQAAILDGKLRGESIDPSSIAVSTDAAYLWCAYTIRLASAIEVMEASTHSSVEVLERWTAQLAARWKDLEEKGYLALGSGVSAPATPANGPTHHIDTYGLTIQNTSDISDLDDSRPRRSDEL